MQIVIDYETRSRLSLRHTNAYKYARHPSTEALCMSWSLAEGGPVEIWRQGEPFPFADFWDDDVHFLAANAEFELEIWNNCCARKYDWPLLPPERISCIQARASYAGLPRKLETLGSALGLGHLEKDKEGNKIMLRLCKPQRGKLDGCEYVGGKFDVDPTKHQRNEAYCVKDTRAERMVARIVPPLPKPERALWLAHQAINSRGVPVDLSLCHKARQLVDWEMDRLSKELCELTKGKVDAPTKLAKLKAWIAEQDYELLDMREETLNWALKGDNGDVPPNVRRALEIRKLCRDAAVSKYQGILNHANHLGRCQGAHVFYKAGPGRFAGAGVNFLNLRRLREDDVPGFVKLADEISCADDLKPIYDRLIASDKGVVPTLGSMVRLAICARPKGKLVIRDYKSIEMRVLHWLAGDAQTLKQIEDFDNGVGEEPYKLAAARIYSKKVSDVTKAERQIGKVQCLGAGYMAGAQTFSAFCENYGIDMPLDRAQDIVQDYRRAYPLVKNLWYALGKAAVWTLKNRKPKTVGLVEFSMTGGTLNCRLPSGRKLKYYDATVFDGMYGEEIEALDQRSGKRKVVGLPILIENIDQAASRDLLADALLKCHAERLPVVLHVYDEIVLEVATDDDKAGQRLTDIMKDTPKWARGLPIDADGGESRRYTK